MIIKKSFFIIIIFLIFLSSCKKKDEAEYKDIFGELVHTDSFSPKEWENPAARKKIEAIDKDIGKFIQPDIIEPELRKIKTLITSFILNIQSKNFKNVENFLTPSAYNSFILRMPDQSFEKDYILRIAYPDYFEKNRLWVKFKLLFPTKSIIAKFQLEENNDDYLISDFENKFFSDLEELSK